MVSPFSYRIKKVRAKRRAMAGLPPEEENSDDELDEKADYNSDDDDDKPLDINKSVMDGLKLFRSKADETTERQLNADKRVAGSYRRDWDENKEVTPKQGGRTWQAFGGGENGHETFHQARIYNFRDKCVVFARNLKFSNLTQ